MLTARTKAGARDGGGVAVCTAGGPGSQAGAWWGNGQWALGTGQSSSSSPGEGQGGEGEGLFSRRLLRSLALSSPPRPSPKKVQVKIDPQSQVSLGATITKYHKLGGLNHRNPFSHSLEAGSVGGLGSL